MTIQEAKRIVAVANGYKNWRLVISEGDTNEVAELNLRAYLLYHETEVKKLNLQLKRLHTTPASSEREK